MDLAVRITTGLAAVALEVLGVISALREAWLAAIAAFGLGTLCAALAFRKFRDSAY